MSYPSLIRRLIIASLVFVGLLSAWTLIRITPRMVSSQIRSNGAHVTIHTLFNEDLKWAQIIRGIESGDGEWLRVAFEMAPGVDTHPGEELISAISKAIIRNPAGVLSDVVPAYGLTLVCRPPQLHEGSNEDLVRQQERSLLSLTDVSLYSQRDECLRSLRDEQSLIERRRMRQRNSLSASARDR